LDANRKLLYSIRNVKNIEQTRSRKHKLCHDYIEAYLRIFQVTQTIIILN